MINGIDETQVENSNEKYLVEKRKLFLEVKSI